MWDKKHELEQKTVSLTRKVEDVVFYRSWDGLIKFINVFIKNYKLCIKEE